MPTHAKPLRAHADLLDEMTRIGADLIRDLPAKPGPDIARDYSLVTQAMRRSIRLIGELRRSVRNPRIKIRTAARKRIAREILDAIQHRTRGIAADNLRAELLQRLEAPDLDLEIDTSPVADIIRDIARDLGLAATADDHTWQRRSRADIEYLGALASHRRGMPRPMPPNPFCAASADR